MEGIEWVTHSFATANYGTINDVSTATHPEQPSPANRGSFASFVCHISDLERKLRSNPIVLDDSSSVRTTGKILGRGKTFMVKHALWTKDPREPPVHVAMKEVISDVPVTEDTRFGSSSAQRPQVDWKEILFEIRALLHEPNRYHPNIVRLLGIQWGLSPISESTFPVLLIEYASLGSLQSLQSSQSPLPLSVKQKLCYDVGRGLSTLHACGIVHGDMKHENVLIFPFGVPEYAHSADAESHTRSVPYTAKLADFGGTVMDMTPFEARKLETGTPPFEAPEVTNGRLLKKNEMMMTDVYSFGLLVWRLFEDGRGILSIPGALQGASNEDVQRLRQLKASENLTQTAIMAIQAYAAANRVHEKFMQMFSYVILHTVRFNPQERNLVKAQAALRGIKPGGIPAYLDLVRQMNTEHRASAGAPGQHGLARDGLMFHLGRLGTVVDLQDNLPGFRPHLDQPSMEVFSFDPLKLKSVLTWEQQEQMLEEFKSTASASHGTAPDILDLKKTTASFYIFQCYLVEFGTLFNHEQAAQWLLKASSDDDSHEDEDYLSQAWVWRISRAFGLDLGISNQRVKALLRLSAMRGHKICLEDLHELASTGPVTERQDWKETHTQSRNVLLSKMGAVGMGYFFASHLNRPWNTLDLIDVTAWDATVRSVLGNSYQSSLRFSSHSPTQDPSQHIQERGQNVFDKIYINIRGHGPLHYAAAAGMTEALQHLVMTYECDLDLPNQHVNETPLVCASAGGKLECALLLLDNGADPNGYRNGQEGPLHWLSSFLPNEMEIFARRLVAAGAELELRSGGMRHDVRGIRSDWEHIFDIRTTPLGRAVLMNNLDAVKVLLSLGADPLLKSAVKHPGVRQTTYDMTQRIDIASPFELAAIFTHPEILATFITHIDGDSSTPSIKVINEMDMLQLARNNAITQFDPLSLQSRLVRCGSRYKQNLSITLMILCARAQLFSSIMTSAEKQEVQSIILCREVALGNVEIVETLLALRYPANGTVNHRPIEEAIKLNHKILFDMLRNHNADLSIEILTPIGAISLTHACALRPRQSRPGRYIADALITSGVPIESADPRSKSPLVMAILNRNFDVATALFENGASVDIMYPMEIIGLHSPQPRHVSVLVEVLSQHTMRTLESLKFLFTVQEGTAVRRPAFHIDSARKFSVLHLLAGSPNYTEIAQITPRILKLCLDTYNEPEFINYRHPLLGSALSYAAANGHKVMVEELLRRGADQSVGAGPVVRDSVQMLIRPSTSWTPLWTAILRLDEELRKGVLFPSQENPYEWIHAEIIQNLEKCITMLSANSIDALARDAFERLRQKKKLVEETERDWLLQRARDTQSRTGGVEQPLTLSFLPGSPSRSTEDRIREICEQADVDWMTDELQAALGEIRL